MSDLDFGLTPGVEWVLIINDVKHIKFLKTTLENSGHYDKDRVIYKRCDGEYAIPVKLKFLYDNNISKESSIFKFSKPPFKNCILLQDGGGKKTRHTKSQDLQTLLKEIIRLNVDKALGEKFCGLISKVKQYRHGDLVVLSNLNYSVWKDILIKYPKIWIDISGFLQCSRLAVQSVVSSDYYRTPIIDLVLGDSGWVEHTDNGVRYIFDVTKCMFSQGNITEKLRMANLPCKGETVVDLYAGIGYFTLQLLVHTEVICVHACEWNPAAVEALKSGLIANGVSDRCVIYQGDNKKVAPRGIADRVLLGLIPSSEEGWFVACACLRSDVGGWLHVHENVSCKPVTTERESKSSSNQFSTGTENCFADQKYNDSDAGDTCLSQGIKRKQQIWTFWAEGVAKIIQSLLSDLYPDVCWVVTVRHIQHVKAYAPYIDHIVADIECRPEILLVTQ